ncbi:MAG: diaminopimelate epimerase [Bacteroidales bacterium]|nr:diaminopimelate epimerase [Bacteroidales bacterium]
MILSFSKYHGAGNDFVIIDNRSGFFIKRTELIKNLCDRHFGIGADGLMLLETSTKADFHMRYYNSDGNESTMCGNGGRCITLFAHKLGLIGTNTNFLGIDGEHIANLEDEKIVNLKMQAIKGIEIGSDYYFINTGSPHYVCFVNDVNKVDVNREGKRIRNSFNLVNGGTNVNFVDLSQNLINIRTYERGVESETLACGTGSVASAIAVSHQTKSNKSEYSINTQGGKLTVKFNKINDFEYNEIWLKGPAMHVFDGQIII